jgi:cyclopropane-fatty-acyl-phospholipid synthase
MNAKTVIQDLMTQAGIEINGSRPFDVHINDERTYQRWLSEAEMGLGESYMDAWWDCEALDEMINKILLARLDQKIKRNMKSALFVLSTKIFNHQTKSKAKVVGKRHYDLGNELFSKMLDPYMNYSCGYWHQADNLEQAQQSKLDLICKKLHLKPGMKVLDLGCGWGGFAKYAAQNYGVEVLGVTISEKQAEFAKAFCKDLPVEIRFQDYREVKGKFDAVVSIGFFEHVGYKNYPVYMEVVNRCLTEDGISLLHTIGNNTSITHVNGWTNKYIFPYGMIPSVAQIARAAEKYFVIEDLHNFGPDYDKTLMAWYTHFEKAWPDLKALYDDRFYRMWRYYLLSSAGGFRSRFNQLWQFVMTKTGRSQPETRFAML